jgi:hypothetical protein
MISQLLAHALFCLHNALLDRCGCNCAMLLLLDRHFGGVVNAMPCYLMHFGSQAFPSGACVRITQVSQFIILLF